MAAFGWLVTPISWVLIGFIWLYNLVWLFVIDLLKIAIYREFDKQEAGQGSAHSIRKKGGSASIVRKDSRLRWFSRQSSVYALLLSLVFLIFGNLILRLFGVPAQSFAAGVSSGS
jgi:hypothetical protein